MSSTQATYYPVVPAIDLGTVAIGDTQTKSVRIDYRLAPSGSAGQVLTAQTSITNEVFLIDDQGTGGDDIVTLSANGVDFFERLNLSSFPATEPPNFITIYIRVAPTTADTNQEGDYLVYLRSVFNKAFSLPIHFRIVGGRYVTANDVRRALGPLGKQKNVNQVYQDSFGDTNAPLWTNETAAPNGGTWTYPRDNVRTAATATVSQNALSTTKFSDFGDYNVSVVAKAQSTGDFGIVFGYVNASNYFRATVSTRLFEARIEEMASGTISVVSQTSVGGLEVGKEVYLRVEKHPTTAEFFVNEAPTVKVGGIAATGYSGLMLTSSGGNISTVDFREYHVTQETPIFLDADINEFILEEEKFVELRTGRTWVPQIVTELLDYNEQDVIRMPFIAARTFNTFPTFGQRTTPLDARLEKAIYLTHRPIQYVIALEENMGSDSSADSWELRTQGRDGDYIVYPALGKIVFVDQAPYNGHQNLRVIYCVGTASVPPEVKQYVAYKSALSILTTIGGVADGVEQMVEKMERKIRMLEEFIPQKTLQYAVGSGKPVR